MAKMNIDKNTPWQDLTPGGVITQSGNAQEFKTGDWRSANQFSYPKNVNNAVFVTQFAQIIQFQLDQMEIVPILIMITAKDVAFVPRYVPLEQLR